jgi:hypothetical protein
VTERERLILIAKAKQKQQQAAQPQTNLVEQVGTGTSEGIANMAGLPVDLVTKGLNLFGAGIEKPFGGSESIQGLLDPFMSDVDPQTAGQRVGRRVGQDVGAGAVGGPVAGASSLGGMALNTAADAASGLAGGITSELTDNPVIDAIVSLLAGGGVVAGAKANRPNGVPSIGDLKSKAGRLYDQVSDSDFRLTPEQTQELQGNVSARMYEEGMDPPLDTKAARGVNRVYELGDRTPEGAPTLNDIEDARRFISRKVVPSQEPGEQGLGLAMKQEIDRYIDKIAASPNAPEDVLALKEARATTRKYKGAETLDSAFDKAALRAASTGVGGNDINAMRQNIRKILDSPKLSAGYSAEEKKAMETIVRGTKTTNTARFLGGLAPQRGMLPGWAAAGQAAAVGASGNPVYAAPAVIGTIAQFVGEKLTQNQIKNLSEIVRNGGSVAPKRLTEGEQAVLNALLASQAAQQSQ